MELDEKAFEAAERWWIDNFSSYPPKVGGGALKRFVQAYLAAAVHPEGEPDRLAVVFGVEDNGDEEIVAKLIKPGDDMDQAWSDLEGCGWAEPPYVRQIVEVHLKRREKPAVVKGRVAE